MAQQRKKSSEAKSGKLRLPLPFDPPTWIKIVESLDLSPQQARIVECILRGMCDKQIAQDMGIRRPTVRTHLARIFQHLEIDDRVHLVLRVFAESRNVECNQY